MRLYNQISGQNIQRIEALSDRVFAVAITLLGLDIGVPVREHINSEKDLMIGFGKLMPKLLSYLLSFMTLGIFWTAHSSIFHFIKKSDRNLNWINLAFLLFVTLTPFTTAFLSEYIEFRFAVGIYWLNLFLIGMMLNRVMDYADKHNFINSELVEKSEIKQAMMRRARLAQTLYACGALLCFVSTYLSITVLILVQFYFVLGLFSKAPFKRVARIK